MASYSFVTQWRIEAPIDRVFATIARSDEWPLWWPSVVYARRPADGAGPANRIDFCFRGPIPYAVRFSMTYNRIEPPTALEGEAAGELEGSGRWRLRRDGGATLVTYHWDVHTTGWLFNALARLGGRPLFRWNHDRVMTAGGRGLARWLATHATQEVTTA